MIDIHLYLMGHHGKLWKTLHVVHLEHADVVYLTGKFLTSLDIGFLLYAKCTNVSIKEFIMTSKPDHVLVALQPNPL